MTQGPPGGDRRGKSEGGKGGKGRPTGKGGSAGQKKGARSTRGPGPSKSAVKADSKKPADRAKAVGAPGGPILEDSVGEEWAGPDEGAAPLGAPLIGEIRDLGPPERAAIEEALDRFGDRLLEHLEDEEWVLKVVVRTDIEPHRRVFRMRRATLQHLAPFHPIFLGVPLAHLARKASRLTLEGGRLIAPYATRRAVMVNEKGGQLFLYGRHLFTTSLVRVEGRPEAGDEVLVLREAEGDDPPRFLGLGIADRALRPLVRREQRGEGTEIVIRNRLDLGLYLRAQQEIPE